MNRIEKIKEDTERTIKTMRIFMSGNDFIRFDRAFFRETQIERYKILSVDFSSESTFRIILSYVKNGQLFTEEWQTDMNSPNLIKKKGTINRR